MMLKTGNKYEIDSLVCVGFTDGDGTGDVGYNYVDYFSDDGTYLGPDNHGIEPIFEEKTNV